MIGLKIRYELVNVCMRRNTSILTYLCCIYGSIYVYVLFVEDKLELTREKYFDGGNQIKDLS